MSRKKVPTRECKRCGTRFPESRSQCPDCGAWCTDELFDETLDGTFTLDEVPEEAFQRIQTGPWDIAFCKEDPGIVTTSVTLLGGAPGAGKSTMSIQLCDAIAGSTGKEVLYIGAEESKGEYANRAKRLKLKNTKLIRLYPMGSNADVGLIIMARKPSAIVIDSLPGLTKDPAVAKDICKTFCEYAKLLQSPVIIIDHVTKDGDLAGFMELQHDVDIVLTLFPNADTEVRTLTVVKNRYASANHSIFLEMTGEGLKHFEFQEDDDD